MVVAAGSADERFIPLLALTLLATVMLTLALRRVRLPALPGYFLCGFVLARLSPVPMGAGTEAAELLRQMADVGILLLMFTVGAECTRHELLQLRKTGLGAGLWQMGLTAGLAGGTALLCGWSGAAAAVAGVAAALSSTAVGVRLFEDMGLQEHAGARLTLGIALVQDLLVIVALLLLEGAGSAGGGWERWAALAGKAVLFVGCAAVLSRVAIPRLLRSVSRTRSRELFTLTVLAVCAGVAALAQVLGVGMSLGAFAAGVVVSGSVYSHRILADAAPFRDFFLTVFFLSVGAMVDPAALAAHWQWVAAGTAAALLVKPFLTRAAGRLGGATPHAATAAALALAGCGEFSVVLCRDAAARGLIPESFAGTMLAVTAFSLTLSPFLMKAGMGLGCLEAKRGTKPATTAGKATAASASERVKRMEDHAILCGYGTVGQMLHRGLQRLGIPVLVVELNAETVRSLLKQGHAVLFADIAQADTLELAGIARARLLVVTFPQAEVARTVITLARERNPEAVLLCRARFPDEAEMLRGLAPDGVVHDEFEAGSRMLRLCSRAFGGGGADGDGAADQSPS